jgi:hypothetical protein
MDFSRSFYGDLLIDFSRLLWMFIDRFCRFFMEVYR